MIIQPVVVKHLINGIIAPHGISDIIHAHQNDLTKQLLQINFFGLGTSLILNKYNHFILNSIFLLSSIIHFRHDMPKISKIPRYTLSIFMVFSLFFINPLIFLVYMLLVHVPHHYMMSWQFLKKEKLKSFLTILFSSGLLLKSGLYFEVYLKNSMLFNGVKGLIISHIIYEELFVHLNSKQQLFLAPFKNRIKYHI